MTVMDPRSNRPGYLPGGGSEREQIENRLIALRQTRTAKSLDLSELDASIAAHEARLAELPVEE